MTDFLEQVVAERRAYVEQARNAPRVGRDRKHNLLSRAAAHVGPPPRRWSVSRPDPEALSDAELRRFVERARELNMGTLVEAHEPVAFGRAVAAGSGVVGINARNLRRPKEIDVGRVRQLHSFVRPNQILIAESGITSA